MSRIVRVTGWGSHGWFISVCDKCGAEVGMSAQTHTREQAETARCFVCEPVPKGTITFLPDPEDAKDFAAGVDVALHAVNANYAADCAERERQARLREKGAYR